MQEITASTIYTFRNRLEQHPVYKAVDTIEHLRCFMEHHVYSVWDFMSLIKFLQHSIAPARYPWVPTGDGNIRRFINELVLEEESDEAVPVAGVATQYASHFELYCGAMKEIGANYKNPLMFVDAVRKSGIEQALLREFVPQPSKQFMAKTFSFIDSNKPHIAAAALALGREHIIPGMFRSFLKSLGVTQEQAPTFYYYLNRHVHLDEDFHAPLSLRLLNSLCQDDKQKQEEAIDAAEQSVNARLLFWDGVLQTMNASP